jgi:hypothetical protein
MNALGAISIFLGYTLFAVGNLYWLFLSFQLGSFWMFILGVMPPTIIISGVTGAYSLLFDVPNWVYGTFG